MKTAASTLILALVLGTGLEASAQFSRKDYPQSGSRTTTTSGSSTSRNETTSAPSRNTPAPDRSTQNRDVYQTSPTPSRNSPAPDRSTQNRDVYQPAPTPSRNTPAPDRSTQNRDVYETAPVPSRSTPAPDRSTQDRDVYERAPGSGWGTTAPRTPNTTTTAPLPTGGRSTTSTRGGSVVFIPAGWAGSEVRYRGNMTRRERENLQAQLNEREQDLWRWDENLDQREADLSGRRYYPENRRSRYATYRLLSERELCDWSADLKREYDRLARRESQIREVGDREYRDRNNRGRGNGRGNRPIPTNSGNNSGGGMCPPSW